MRAKPFGDLCAVLCDPAHLSALGHGRLEAVMRLAARNFLMGRLAEDAIDCGAIEALPSRAQAILESAVFGPRQTQRKLRHEAGIIADLFADSGIRPVALKGAAYVLDRSPAARGRISTDIDILVPATSLERSEEILKDAGWQVDPEKDNAYDQAYYRRYMHELPPLLHAERGMVLDVHHAILPPTARLNPAMDALIDAAVRPKGSPLEIFAPLDRILHAATHLCHDGEFQYPLRNLLEIRDLCQEIIKTDEDWNRLTSRAAALGLALPALDALTLLDRFLAVNVPNAALSALASAGRDRPWRRLTRHVMAQTIRPAAPDRPDRVRRLSEWLLYIRSHWLRMPPIMLARHLWTKWRMSAQAPEPSA